MKASSGAAVFFFAVCGIATAELATKLNLGVLVRLRGLGGEVLGDSTLRLAASAMMAVHHVNSRHAGLVSNASSLLPAKFQLSVDFRDSESSPSVSAQHAMDWEDAGVEAIVGTYRSAVAGPLSIVSSIFHTPLIAWGSTSTALSDKSTYPVYSRIVPPDSVLASGMVHVIKLLGWRRFAILAIGDAYGRAFVQEASSAAVAQGLEIAASELFIAVDAESMDSAMARVKASGARIVLTVMFDSNVPSMLEAARTHGLTGAGYVFLMANGHDLINPVNDAQDPAVRADMVAGVTGWLLFDVDPLFGGRGDRFHAALRSEPVGNLASSVAAVDADTLRSGDCDSYCAYIYDAVWVAAIAASRSDVVNGSVNRQQLLREIRRVEVDGASGPVRLDQTTGDRQAFGLPVVISNLAPDPTTPDFIRRTPIWTWDGESGMTRISTAPPVWPGGDQTWDMPQLDVVCEAGEVFSQQTLQCEPCPAGSREINRHCVAFNASVGIMIRLHTAAGEHAGDTFRLIAASALMAVRHVNDRISSLVPDAQALLPPNFLLDFDLQDSFSVPNVAVEHGILWSLDGRDVVVGAYLSAVSGPLSLAAGIHDTPVISWSSTSPSLSDKSTYPFFSRTVASDALLTAGTMRVLRSLGWSTLATLVVDDDYGRNYAQEAASVAVMNGIRIAAAQKFSVGDADSIGRAMETVRAAGARIIHLVAFTSDMPALMAAAEEHGMLGRGYVWLLGDGVSMHDLLSLSDDKERTMRQATGMWRVEMDLLFGELHDRFMGALRAEPMESFETSVPGANVTQDMIMNGRCIFVCGGIYDAVWLAALAASRSSRSEGRPDKADLLRHIRTSAFYGATGDVELDESTGDRVGPGLKVVMKNVQPGPEPGTVVERAIWTWSERDGLEQASDEPPIWSFGDPPTFQPPSDGHSCASGSVYDENTLDCTPCPRGTFQNLQRCDPCPVGQFAPFANASACAPCQEGYADKPGMWECKPCPANTRRPAASTGVSVRECVCNAGFFSEEGPGAECRECMTGAVCPGGVEMPYPRSGFWGQKECEQFGGDVACSHWDIFLPCSGDNCKGGPDFECTEGRSDRLCAGTEEGYTRIGGVWYFECGRYGELITVVAIVAVFLAWFGINALVSGDHEAVNVALLFVQITATISTYSLNWHSMLEVPNLALGIANFDVDLVGPNCLMSWTDTKAFYLQLLLPFILVAFYVGYFVLLALVQRLRGRDGGGDREGNPWERMKRGTVKNFISILLINYTTLCLRCFQTFRCETFPDGREFLLFNPEVECWSRTHWAMTVLSVLYVLLLLVGLPMVVARIVLRHLNQGTLHDREVVWQWALVHASYETPYKYWESMMLLRRFGVAALAVSVGEPMLQGAATVVLLTALMTSHVYARPFISASIDVLDFASILGSMLYVLAGLMMYPSVTKEAQGHICFEGDALFDDAFCKSDADVKTVIAGLCLACIFLTIAVAAVLSVSVVREQRDSDAAGRRMDEHTQTIVGRVSSVEESANKVRLNDILNGTMLFRWVTEEQSVDTSRSDVGDLTRAGSSSIAALLKKRANRWSVEKQAFARSYMMVEDGIKALDVDLTQYSTSVVTRLLRQVVEIEGVLDYTCWKNATGVRGLLEFVSDLAKFVEATESRPHSGSLFPVHNLVQFEYRPLLTYYIITRNRDDKAAFVELVDQVLLANGERVVQHDAIDDRDDEESVRGGTLALPAEVSRSGDEGRKEDSQERSERDVASPQALAFSVPPGAVAEITFSNAREPE